MSLGGIDITNLTPTVKIGSLCTGYAGLDMAAESVFGGRVAWYSEIDKYASSLLSKRLPGVPNHGDLKSIAWEKLEEVDVLTGGYPCQPFSNMGKKLGEDDDRNLWPYIRDSIRILRPGISIFENVAAHLGRGFGSVLRDCAEEGWDVRWETVCASDAGAPHKRERLFFIVTDPSSERLQRYRVQAAGLVEASERSDLVVGESDFRWQKYSDAIERWEVTLGRAAPGPVVLNSNGRPKPTPEFYEWMMGLPAGWVTSREINLSYSQQIKMLGNGVVPYQTELAIRNILKGWN